jgi:hypothetical protein
VAYRLLPPTPVKNQCFVKIGNRSALKMGSFGKHWEATAPEASARHTAMNVVKNARHLPLLAALRAFAQSAQREPKILERGLVGKNFKLRVC